MTQSLLDPEAWETLKSMTDPEFLAELIDVYLKDSPDLISQMHGGLAAGDVQCVRRAAHSLKSNSASFGASLLAEASRALEMLAKGGSLDGAGPLLTEIEAQYARVTPVLLELKNEC